MPCGDGGVPYREGRSEEIAAERAACDLWDAFSRSGLPMERLSRETKKWIKKHLFEDQERLRREEAIGVKEAIRKRALEKLDQDERRELGL